MFDYESYAEGLPVHLCDCCKHITFNDEVDGRTLCKVCTLHGDGA